MFIDDEELTFAPALGDADEESGFDEEETIAAFTGEPSGELDEKLDAFFGSDEETATKDAEAAMGLEEDLVFAPALDDAEEEGGFDEEDAVATMAEEPFGELDEKLDAFFGYDEEVEEFIGAEEDLLVAPALGDTEEEVVEEETAEVQEEALPKENAALLALAGGLAALATQPSAQQIEENQQLVRQIQEEQEQTTEQTVLLQLVNSVLTLIPADSAELPTGTAELTEYLFEQLASQEISSDTLIAAIGRFTDWQKNLMQEILTSSQAIADSTATTPAIDNIAQVASEVRSGFDNLRSTLKEEFTSLRDELKQNR